MLPNGEIKLCSRDINSDLFYATFGGMGLTGVILEAAIRLKRIKSEYIMQDTIKTNNLNETLEAIDSCIHKPYAVAWIDSLANSKNLGRGIVTSGDFMDDESLEPILIDSTCNCSHNESGIINSLLQTSNSHIEKEQLETKRLSIPFYFPSFTLNPLSVKAFNIAYYGKAKSGSQKVHFNSFFYPLDSVLNWNRIYGKNGFLQYQCIIPREHGLEALNQILSIIVESKSASFLNVLKLYGKEDKSLLCFPLEGYSLALDFKITPRIFALLDRLDSIVLSYGGRLYLTKDSRMSKETFNTSYKNAKAFRELRKDYGMSEKLQSLQSNRLNI